MSGWEIVAAIIALWAAFIVGVCVLIHWDIK